MQGKTRTWVQLSIVAYVLILVAVAFLSVLPNIQEADNAKVQLAQVTQENALHEKRLAQLEEEFLGIEAFQAELAELELSIPVNPEYAHFVSTLGEETRKAGVLLSSLSMGDPRSYEIEATLEQPVAAGTAIELPFSLTVIGDEKKLYALVQKLQYDQRLITIRYWQVDTNSSSLNINGVAYVVSNSLDQHDFRNGRLLDEVRRLVRVGSATQTPSSEGVENTESEAPAP